MIRGEKLRGFFYCEGGKDRKFLELLVAELEVFHAKKWFFNYENASGGSAGYILKKCSEVIRGTDYSVIICFIDLDRLKSENKKNWRIKKRDLEDKYSKLNISVIWWEDNLEQELSRILHIEGCGKWKVNKRAKEEIKRFKNSEIWKKVLDILKKKEVKK
jgi:hypothetical protein